MSDKITQRDYVFLAEIPELFNGKGWHGKGLPMNEFTVETMRPVLFRHRLVQTTVDNGMYPVHTGDFIAIAEDDLLPVGKSVGNRFNTPLNEELFMLMQDSLAGSEYKIVSCGTVDNRNEFFVDAKWQGGTLKAGGRDVVPFVGLNRGFGGIQSLTIGGHNWVMQCANTTRLFRSEIGNSETGIVIKNTQAMAQRLPSCALHIEKNHGFQVNWAKAMDAAANEPVSRSDAREAFAGLIVSDAATKLATRSANRVNRLVNLFATGAGNKGENLADWLSAVTDFYSHESAGSVDGCGSRESFLDKQWFASERGSGAKIKEETTKAILDIRKGELKTEAFKAWQKRGQAIIMESDKEVVSLLN